METQQAIRSKYWESLLNTMAKLRNPGGCPWDREQTHESLKKYLIEESYEFLDAIETHNDLAMKEELGDVLLQVIFHAQIANERNAFTIDDVVKGLDEKLVFRHPHVFLEGQQLQTAEEVLNAWEENKKREKQRRGLLGTVAKALPALQRSYQIGDRVAKVGFEWENANEVMARVESEMKELSQEKLGTPEHQEELGDVLFTMAQYARKCGYDPEELLQKANKKFARRFEWMESKAKSKNEDLKDLGKEKLEALWVEAKRST